VKAGRALSALALLALAAGAALLGTQAARQAAGGGVAAAGARLDALAPWFALFRMALVAAAVAGWPWLARRAARRFQWSEGATVAAAGLRWRVLAWFAVFELVVQSGRIVRWIAG